MAGPLTEMMAEIGRSQRAYNSDLMRAMERKQDVDFRQEQAVQEQKRYDNKLAIENEQFKQQFALRQGEMKFQKMQQATKDVALMAAEQDPKERMKLQYGLMQIYGDDPDIGPKLKEMGESRIFVGKGQYVNTDGKIYQYEYDKDKNLIEKPVAWGESSRKAYQEQINFHETMTQKLMTAKTDNDADGQLILSGGKQPMDQNKLNLMNYHQKEAARLKAVLREVDLNATGEPEPEPKPKLTVDELLNGADGKATNNQNPGLLKMQNDLQIMNQENQRKQKILKEAGDYLKGKGISVPTMPSPESKSRKATGGIDYSGLEQMIQRQGLPIDDNLLKSTYQGKGNPVIRPLDQVINNLRR